MVLKRAILYFRTSGEVGKANRGFGLADQKADCEKYCNQNGLEIVNSFCDDGVSGSDEYLGKSHALLEMLSSLNGDDLVIVTKNSDRICGRGEYRAAWVRREIVKSGHQLVCADQPDYDIYSDDPTSVMMQKIIDAVAIFEKMNIALRLAKSRRQKVKKTHQRAAGKAPFGYRWENKKLVIDDAEAPAVREIFKMAVAGFSCRAIAERISSEYLVKMNGPRVNWILKNEAYLGKMKYGATEAMNESLALIPKVTFGKARAGLRRRKK